MGSEKADEGASPTLVRTHSTASLNSPPVPRSEINEMGRGGTRPYQIAEDASRLGKDTFHRVPKQNEMGTRWNASLPARCNHSLFVRAVCGKTILVGKQIHEPIEPTKKTFCVARLRSSSKTANFQWRDPAQARATRRGLEHSRHRRFAVHEEGCDKFAPFLLPTPTASQKQIERRMP